MLNDYGIILEIIGFALVLLTANRNPKGGHLLLESHEDSPFDTLREKIIPDNFIHMTFGIGIGAVILGLFFQLGFFNP